MLAAGSGRIMVSKDGINWIEEKSFREDMIWGKTDYSQQTAIPLGKYDLSSILNYGYFTEKVKDRKASFDTMVVEHINLDLETTWNRRYFKWKEYLDEMRKQNL